MSNNVAFLTVIIIIIIIIISVAYNGNMIEKCENNGVGIKWDHIC